MNGPTDHPSIEVETAMLIERAVRSDLSPEERSRLDELVAADPSVALELEHARREEHAMHSAATLLTQQTDPERMRMAIEQKLKLDRRGLRFVVSGFVVFVLLFSLFAAQERWPWGVLAPIALCLVWWLITEMRFRRFKRSLLSNHERTVKEFEQHLSRSREGIVIGKAAVIILVLALSLVVVDHLADAAYAKATLIAICGLVVMLCARRTLFNRHYQQRYDQFLQGRLSIEELFDKRAESAESDGE